MLGFVQETLAFGGWGSTPRTGKIQDNYKPDLFEVVGKHQDPNAFYVKPIDGKGLAKQVNRHQMFDLGVTEREREERDSEQIEDDPGGPYSSCLQSKG